MRASPRGVTTKRKTSNNSKGPKGKKARAKAKLDRQWGEEEEDKEAEDGKPTTRRASQPHNRHLCTDSRSRSRMGPSLPPSNWNNSSRGKQTEKNDVDEDDVDEDLSVEDPRQALSLLLTSIKRQKGQRIHKSSRFEFIKEGESSGADDDERQGRCKHPQHSHLLVDDPDSEEKVNEKDEGEGDDEYNHVNVIKLPLVVDPFKHRFYQPPLPEDEQELKMVLSQFLHSETVPINSDPAIIFQVSQVLLNNLKIQKTSGIDEVMEDESAAALPLPVTVEFQCQRLAWSWFVHACRPSLQVSWKAYQNTRGRLTQKRSFFAFNELPQSWLYPFISSYADLLLLQSDFSHKSFRQDMDELISLHLLNHILTGQASILRHNHQRHGDDEHCSRRHCHEEEIDVEEPPRDQGFTRPTVLVLLPTRGSCYDFVQLVRHILDPIPTCLSREKDPNEARFNVEYGPLCTSASPPSSHSLSNNSDDKDYDKTIQSRRRRILRQKGDEWWGLWGDDVNSDDDFKIGLSILPHVAKKHETNNPKQKKPGSYSPIKLFTDFYQSDIIVASPLGLKILLDKEHKEDGSRRKEDRRHDFLSSIEVCYIPRSDTLLMQNWDHVTDVMKLLNETPIASTCIDYSRVRPYHLLPGQSQHWRQLIVTGSFVDPMVLSLFKRYAKSLSGWARLRRKTKNTEASVAQIVIPTRQVFQRISTQSLMSHADDRVQYFCEAILPEITTRYEQKRTMVFIPSYFDYVSVRNVMLKREIDFVSVTEYSRVSEVSRGRARFLQGRVHILLYSGRAHFFHRHFIKGVKHIIFLSLPEYPDFYSDLVNRLNEGITHSALDSSTSALATAASSLALFTKYDGHALERIVGCQNCSRMIKEDTATFLF